MHTGALIISQNVEVQIALMISRNARITQGLVYRVEQVSRQINANDLAKCIDRHETIIIDQHTIRMGQWP